MADKSDVAKAGKGGKEKAKEPVEIEKEPAATGSVRVAAGQGDSQPAVDS